MLLANPIVTFDTSSSRTPRIISEVRKQQETHNQIRPRITGELLVLLGTERRWAPRRVLVRSGQLLLGSQLGEPRSGLRIPLRQLSLQAGPLPNSLSLVRGQSILLTLQTSNERSFDLWVKTIAIELIRQTPLESIKYLDILNLTDTRRNKDCARLTASETPCITCTPPSQPADIHYDINKNHVKIIDRNHPAPEPKASTVEVLLKKCQSSESYVPVKEKLVLFESLCRIGRVQSTENVSIDLGDAAVGTKRARSMHDLTYCFSTTGVREICKYFETKLDDENHRTAIARKTKRLINSDSNLNRFKFTLNRNLQNVSYA